MEIVVPWKPEDFKRSVGDRNSVYYHLNKLKYPVSKFKTQPKDESLIKVLKDLFPAVVENKWVVVLSNNNKILQSLATLLPITYSLSTVRSCFNVSNLNLAQLFSARKPYDVITPYPEGDLIHKAQVAGLLMWEAITDSTYAVTKQSGNFSDFLRSRLERKCSTVFMTSYTGNFNSATVERMLNLIKAAVGENASSIIIETAEIKNYVVKQKEFYTTSKEV